MLIKFLFIQLNTPVCIHILERKLTTKCLSISESFLSLLVLFPVRESVRQKRFEILLNLRNSLLGSSVFNPPVNS